MEIGIFGLGAIGGALHRYLAGNKENKFHLFDPSRGHKDDMRSCDMYFLCVPVPNLPTGLQDYSNIEKCLYLLDAKKPVFCRSTVLPGTCDRFGIHAMPEFLTEGQADSDIAKIPWVFGSKVKEGPCPAEACLEAIQNGAEVSVIINRLKNIDAEYLKYFHNAFLSLKNTAMNMFFDFYQFKNPYASNADFQKIADLLPLSGLISKSHLKIMHKGKRGFNGKCLPKDLKAFLKFMIKSEFKAHGLLFLVHSYNKMLLNKQGLDLDFA